jgi:hypothetical protein
MSPEIYYFIQKAIQFVGEGKLMKTEVHRLDKVFRVDNGLIQK